MVRIQKGKKGKTEPATLKDEPKAASIVVDSSGLPPFQQPQTSEKKLSSNIQKLRFMKIAEHDREQTRLKFEPLENDANLPWCILGYEDEVRAASKRKSQSDKSTNASMICVQARRSYGGMNKSVEEAMNQISRRLRNKQKQREEINQARRLSIKF